MNLVRYNNPLFTTRLNNVFDSLFDESNINNTKNKFQPKVNISENEKSFSVNAELPGVKKEDIHVDLAENKLTISGEKKSSNEDKKENYHLIENRFGSFSRTFHLPDNANREKIEARFEDGVLSLMILKKKEDKVINKITIN